jgi:predicted ABC-class ATPase
VKDQHALESTIRRIDGRGYKAYRDLVGPWEFPDFTLDVDHAQSDPFAAPSRVSVRIDPVHAGFGAEAFHTRTRAIGTACLLARSFSEAAVTALRRTGSGRSGEIRMESPGQLVLDQTAVGVDDTGRVEARFTVGLPGRGRSVAGHEAIQLLLTDVPRVIRTTLLAAAYESAIIHEHADANEDAAALRHALEQAGLVAFIADGAVLPRMSGVDDRPLADGPVVSFQSPESLRVEIETPNRGLVTGMGVPNGVTLIVGGGFHGKSTVLRAIQDGVYNHRPGDGRERVVSRDDCAKIRAEDGRSVAGVNISSFIDGLPFERDTKSFSTAFASGSTSQAAAIVEALEAGAGTLLVDEDTSATNFMIRDRRMQELVPAEGEPITPFVDLVRSLYVDRGVSTVLVIGGSGDYLDAADAVIRMADYQPHDVTGDAREIATRFPTGRQSEKEGVSLVVPTPRRLVPGTVDPRRGKRNRHVRVPDDRTLLFGEHTIDLTAIEQIVSRAQIRAIGEALVIISSRAGGAGGAPSALPELLDAVAAALATQGLDCLGERRTGDLAEFRRLDLASTLNRLRTLRVD